MRTLILVVFTCFILTLGYMAYWWTQPTHSKQVRKSDKDQAALPLKDRETNKPYGGGQNVWVKKFDPDTAKIVSRFKANDYQPRNDGWIVVKQPRAQFFMKDGRAISVEGESGEIIMDDNNKTGMKALAGSQDTPSRGRLYNVTIHMYHEIDRPEEQLDETGTLPRPAMTITLNNASFDNQTFKIYSEGFGKGKRHVEADMVPVTLRGDDYDFDGKGLIIRWNERDRRLQLLEVAHGETLTIKHPNSIMKKDEPTTAPSVALERPLPVMLTAKNRAATGDALSTPPAAAAPAAAAPAPSTRRSRPSVPKPKITPNTDPPLYRAIFHDNVRIVQGADLNVTANKMSVDFLMQDQSDAPPPEAATKPAGRAAKAGAATQPVSADAKPSAAATAPATQLARKGGKRQTTAPTTTAARRGRGNNPTPSSTQPTDDGQIPVVITWTGKLVVEPLSVGPENPIKNGDAVVRLDGAPVIATQQDSTIYSGTLTYRTEDQAMLLTPMGPDKPIIMTDTKGSLVHTTRMDFFQPKHQAILYGASDALFPQVDESGKPGAPLLAKWSKTCTLYFANSPKAEGASTDIASSSSSMNIERAELDGDVFVDHPQLKLNSQALELTFDTSKKATTKPTTTNPTTQSVQRLPQAPQKQSPLSKQFAGLQATIKEHDDQIAQALAPFNGANLDTLLQSKSQQLQALEIRLAQQSKAIKDLADAGQSPPKPLREEYQAGQTFYAAVKSEFEQTQKTLLQVQDLRSERDELARQGAQIQRQLAANAVTRPILMADGTTTRPTSQPTTRPAIRSDLKQLVATGAVHCLMTDSAKKTQTIDCNRLTLQTSTTPEGRIYPNTVNADGDVHAIDPDQDLRAGHLAVTLRPTTQPAKAGGDNANAELKSLIAHKDVKVVSKDGTITLSDQLLVDSKDGHNNIKLLGQPATIIDKKSTLTGPVIEIFPDAQQLQIVGNGNMKGVQQEKPGEPERPIDVTWVRGMVYDGKANTVDITGQVVAVTKDAEGATNTARGERVKMILADAAPSTQPATQSTTQPTAVALATTQPTSQPTTKPAKGQYGAMASKNVRHITFDDNATITSITLADDASLLRRTHLEAATVNYDLLLKKLLVPVKGRMIIEDHRPATTQPAGSVANNNTGAEPRPAGAKVDSGAENNRGSTAFQWSKQFTYDDAVHQAVMEGDSKDPVVVVHRDDSPKAQLFRLTGETVTADMEAVAAATQPTTKSTTKPAGEQQAKVQLKLVTAVGHILFTGPGAEIHALYMQYDPKTHWLIARGNERERVDFTIATQPGGAKLAEEIQYNLDTGEVKATKMSVKMGR
ncbi:MAG: hypothetical protein JWN40_497 [Phycisphaerales bacterium]|nr:hypothetical protein [Phycisphaerales bacterium]